MTLFTERLRPDLMFLTRPPMRTQPLCSGVGFLADLLEPPADPEELVDTYVDEPTTTCAPAPRRTQPSLVTMLDPGEIGGKPPPPFSLIVVDDGLDEETYAASSTLDPATRRRARTRRVMAYAALAGVSLLGLAELVVFAAG